MPPRKRPIGPVQVASEVPEPVPASDPVPVSRGTKRTLGDRLLTKLLAETEKTSE